MYMYNNIYIYIYIERERDIAHYMCMCIYIYIYIMRAHCCAKSRHFGTRTRHQSLMQTSNLRIGRISLLLF